jgi:transcriptional regulator with XRE-family HTH domain
MPSSIRFSIMSDDLAKQLPKRVIELRKAVGLTQAVVAQRLDITEGRYGHYERGFRRFPVDILPKLAEALQCQEIDLFGSGELKPKKKGPSSRVEIVADKISKLPRNKQNVILNMIEGALNQTAQSS